MTHLPCFLTFAALPTGAPNIPVAVNEKHPWRP